MTGETSLTAVLVFRCEIDAARSLTDIVAELGTVEGVKSVWGWAGVHEAAQAVLDVVDPSFSSGPVLSGTPAGTAGNDE